MPPFHFWTERPLLSVTVTPLARNIETWQTCCNFKLFVASLPRFDLFFAHAAQGTNGIQWFSASRSLKTWLKWRNVGTMKHPVCLARKQYLQTGSRGRVFFFFFDNLCMLQQQQLFSWAFGCVRYQQKDHSYQIKLRDGIQCPCPVVVSCWVEEMIRLWRSQKGFMQFNLYQFMSATK